jgi:hypothetical protein
MVNITDCAIACAEWCATCATNCKVAIHAHTMPSISDWGFLLIGCGDSFFSGAAVHDLVGSNWIFFCMFTVIYQACLGSFMLQLSICPRSVWDIIWLIGIWLVGSWSISPKMGGKVASNEHTWPMGVHRSSKVCFSSSALKLISHQYYKFLVLGTSFYSNL